MALSVREKKRAAEPSLASCRTRRCRRALRSASSDPPSLAAQLFPAYLPLEA